MKSDVLWEVTGVRQRAREAAREAARRSGMSVGEWLDSAILDSARGDGTGLAPAASDQDETRPQAAHREQPVQRPYSDHEERHRRVPDDALSEVKDRLEMLNHRFEQRQPRVGDGDLALVNDRLDTLSRQLDQLAYASAQIAQGTTKGDDETAREITGAISKLDQRLDQLIEESRSTSSEIERRVSEVDRAVALMNREPPPPATPAAPAGPATPLEQALAEIAERQRSLDGEAALPRVDLPRAPTQGFEELERQLRGINARIETLKPCRLDSAVETLRDDLAEIGLMIKEAVPRQAVEALENEVRALAERIDSKRNVGADGPAIAGVELGLAEVRDALRALTPAENLVGLDEAVRALTHKIDAISTTTQDPAAIQQLESAIASLRNVASHVASNDALATLSAEVRSLAGKFEHVASPDILAALEQRIAIIADALAASNRGGNDAQELQAVVQGLNDKVERLQLNRTDQTAASTLEDRIATLMEKLDTSDNRLSHLESIERGLAELLIHIEHQRAPEPAAAAVPQVDALQRDVQRAQDSLEAVHGTLGHVVDRLAMIESGIRNATAMGLPKAADPEQPPPWPPAPPRGPKPELPERETPEPPAFMPALALREPPAAPPPPQPASDPAPMPAPVPVPAMALGNPAPPSDREPIDPDLPPDHPIEPGASKRRSGSPADRIAASEAALGPVRPPVIPDPAGKSNFIAAARRAAQAAGAEPPPRTDKSQAAAAGESVWAQRIRSFLIAASVVAIVVGSFQLLSSLFSGSDAPEAPPQAQPSEAPNAPPAAPAEAGEPPAKTAAPPDNRQSSNLPSGVPYMPSVAGIVLPGEPARQPPPSFPDAGADPVATGSVRAPSIDASPGAPLPPARGAAPTSGDKLPAAIGGTVLRTAAAKGDSSAEFEVAVRFADGRRVPQDLTAAAEWFERAAIQGLVPAQFRLGGLYEKGMGVKKDLGAARRLYVAAAEAGHGKAMHNLAVLYSEGIDGKPDYATAARWFRKAADYGVVDSQYNLAILYARGIGIEVNLAESYKWFSLAARSGDGEAAKKRDDVGARLDQTALAAARAAAQAWVAQPQPEAATQVKVPPAGWDAAPAPSTAGRRVSADGKSPRAPQ